MEASRELLLLIDRASAIAGSDYKLAQALNTSRQRVSDWRHGRTTCPPADQGLMAAMVGMDPVAVIAQALMAKAHGDRLKQVPGLGEEGND